MRPVIDGAVSLAEVRSPVYGAVRAPGMHLLPRPNAYRPHWTKPDGTIDTDKYIDTRLVNVLAQQHARQLKAMAGDLFLEEKTSWVSDFARAVFGAWRLF